MIRPGRPILWAALVFLAASVLAQSPPGVYAITGGTVHTASGPEIANGTVIVRDGLIEAVGSGIPVPADASVIDVNGAQVYPGLFDAQTSLGFPGPRPATRRRGSARAATSAREEALPETSPAFLAMRSANLNEDDVDDRRSIGVTTILTAPAFGIFNGQSAIVNLGEGPMESRIIKSPAAEQISFTPRPAWTYPDSLMGVISYIRQTFLDAQHYGVARAIYEKNPAGEQRPETSEVLAALGPVLSSSVPVVFMAESELMIRRAAAIAHEFNLRPIYSGARQGYAMADELRAWNVPVLVSVNWPKPPAKDEREEQALRVIRDRVLAPTTPAALAQRGITFALVSGSGKSGDYLPGIRKAIDNGLSADDALRATTLWPARIFGIDRQLGSLERGKIANVVVTDKPIFAKDAKVTHLFVDGRELRLPPRDKKPAESGASAVDGTWNLTVRTPQGDVSMRATLHNEDGALTGIYSGDRGSGDIRSGSFDAPNVEFTISIRGQQETESSDWVFHGTITDSSMQGSVTTTLGTFTFTGSKSR